MTKEVKIRKLNVKVEADLYDEFSEVVKAKGCQISYEVREFMKRYIREYRAESK